MLLIKIGCVFLKLYGIIPLLNQYQYRMCIGKGVLTRRVSEAFFIEMDPGGYGGDGHINVIIRLGNPGYSYSIISLQF